MWLHKTTSCHQYIFIKAYTRVGTSKTTDTCWYCQHFWNEENGWRISDVSVLPVFPACSVRWPHLYYAGCLLCIRWWQTPQSTTSCTTCCLPHDLSTTQIRTLQELKTYSWVRGHVNIIFLKPFLVDWHGFTLKLFLYSCIFSSGSCLSAIYSWPFGQIGLKIWPQWPFIVKLQPHISNGSASSMPNCGILFTTIFLGPSAALNWLWNCPFFMLWPTGIFVQRKSNGYVLP